MYGEQLHHKWRHRYCNFEWLCKEREAGLILLLRCIPSLKLFLKRRGKFRRWRMRPVPVVFLRMAFTLQLSAKKEQRKERPTAEIITQFNNCEYYFKMQTNSTMTNEHKMTLRYIYNQETLWEKNQLCKNLWHFTTQCTTSTVPLVTQVMDQGLTGANARCRISTSWAPAFLNVETAATTAPAQCVRLVPALAKTTCSLTL